MNTSFCKVQIISVNSQLAFTRFSISTWFAAGSATVKAVWSRRFARRRNGPQPLPPSPYNQPNCLANFDMVNGRLRTSIYEDLVRFLNWRWNPKLYSRRLSRVLFVGNMFRFRYTSDQHPPTLTVRTVAFTIGHNKRFGNLALSTILINWVFILPQAVQLIKAVVSVFSKHVSEKIYEPTIYVLRITAPSLRS